MDKLTTESDIAQEIREWAMNVAKDGIDITVVILEALDAIENDWSVANTGVYELNQFHTRSGNPETFHAPYMSA